ncbi:hypothetical protein [Ralstonia phage RP12]|uniref:Uncharacterized protein n=1 Tax=Ralstonia phage RP12 TaxID=1923889 RepID=A0A1L7N1A1_9CAUD|nr:hypothetical protein FDH28_gp138 [Ralstonia phage RP12]BAW19257.1 hypothetical protein [Ralstonia phage RP12]
MTTTTGIGEYRNAKLSQDITAIHEALVVNAEVKKIPESTFVNEILPVITGEVVSSDFPLLMAAVAGNPFAEVDVVDADGKVRFRMPSLLERNIVNHLEASKRGSMSSMLITAGMLSNQSPARAEKYLEHEFNGRGIATNRDELFKQRQDRWNAILALYGKTLKIDGSVVDGASVAAVSTEKPALDFEDGELL